MDTSWQMQKKMSREPKLDKPNVLAGVVELDSSLTQLREREKVSSPTSCDAFWRNLRTLRWPHKKCKTKEAGKTPPSYKQALNKPGFSKKKTDKSNPSKAQIKYCPDDC